MLPDVQMDTRVLLDVQTLLEMRMLHSPVPVVLLLLSWSPHEQNAGASFVSGALYTHKGQGRLSGCSLMLQ